MEVNDFFDWVPFNAGLEVKVVPAANATHLALGAVGCRALLEHHAVLKPHGDVVTSNAANPVDHGLLDGRGHIWVDAIRVRQLVRQDLTSLAHGIGVQ